MPCVAEFGIIEEFDPEKNYMSYEPKKYNCIAIDDDYIEDWWRKLTTVKTYFHCYSRPEFALARWGITLIPPESLGQFYDIVARDSRSETVVELIALKVLLQKAITENKYVIHFGV